MTYYRLVDDGEDEWYTVVGIVPETMERWAESYFVDTALHAEAKAVADLADRGFHIMVAGVVQGKIGDDVYFRDGYARYVDPQATSVEQVKMLMEEWGVWKFGQWHNETDEKPKKKWFK